MTHTKIVSVFIFFTSNELAEDEAGEMVNRQANYQDSATVTHVPDWSCPFCEEKFPGSLTESKF